ncbi:hypothetical protein [Streptomyces goshikiensis]
MYDVLRSTLPEFLGSLSAASVIATAAWAVRKLRARRTEPGAEEPLPPSRQEL